MDEYKGRIELDIVSENFSKSYAVKDSIVSVNLSGKI